MLILTNQNDDLTVKSMSQANMEPENCQCWRKVVFQPPSRQGLCHWAVVTNNNGEKINNSKRDKTNKNGVKQPVQKGRLEFLLGAHLFVGRQAKLRPMFIEPDMCHGQTWY